MVTHSKRPDYRANPEIGRRKYRGKPAATSKAGPLTDSTGAPYARVVMKQLLIKSGGAVRRWHSTTIFALIGLAFLLPFATVTVGGCGPTTTTTTFSGAQLVTWSVPHNAGINGAASVEATVALVAAVLGFILAAFAVAKGPGWCAAAGLSATLLLAANVSSNADSVRFHSGYKLILFLFLWAAAIQARRAWRRRVSARRLRLQQEPQ